MITAPISKANMEEKKAHKVQTTITSYQQFVLEGLIDVQGRSMSDVLHYIITSYIGDNVNLLDSCQLTVKDWKKIQK